MSLGTTLDQLGSVADQVGEQLLNTPQVLSSEVDPTEALFGAAESPKGIAAELFTGGESADPSPWTREDEEWLGEVGISPETSVGREPQAYSLELAQWYHTVGENIINARMSVTGGPDSTRVRSPSGPLGLIKKLKAKVFGGEVPIEDNRPTEKDMIRREAHLGGQIIGSATSGTSREFFLLDPHTWVWYEKRERLGQNGGAKVTITRYEISNQGITKTPNGNHYTRVEGAEAEIFKGAVHRYAQLVGQHIYGTEA